MNSAIHISHVSVYTVKLVLSAFKMLNHIHEGSSRRLCILEKEVVDWKDSYELTLQQLRSAEDENLRLIDRLENADTEFNRRQAEADNFKKEKTKLEDELSVVRQAEQQYSKEVTQIHSEIKDKEAHIQKLSLELRRLNSLKTIHEMKHKDFTPEAIFKCRQNRMTPRKSVPYQSMFSINSPLSSPLSKAFSFESKPEGLNLIGEQRKHLKSQHQDLKSKRKELDEREAKLRNIEDNMQKRSNSQLNALVQECEMLKVKILQLEAKNQELQELQGEVAESSCPSEAGPDLFSEIQLTEQTLQTESGAMQIESAETRTSYRTSVRMSQAKYERMKLREQIMKEYQAKSEKHQEEKRGRCCSFW